MGHSEISFLINPSALIKVAKVMLPKPLEAQLSRNHSPVTIKGHVTHQDTPCHRAQMHPKRLVMPVLKTAAGPGV
jgi:hypothetical protein